MRLILNIERVHVLSRHTNVARTAGASIRHQLGGQGQTRLWVANC